MPAGAALSYVMLALASALWMIYAARGFAGLMAGNLGVASAAIFLPESLPTRKLPPPRDSGGDSIHALLRIAVTAFFLGLLTAVVAHGLPLMLAAIFLAITGATVCVPLLNTLVSHRTPADSRGRVLGTTSSVGSWGRVCGPLVAGANLAWLGYQGAWLGAAAICLVYLCWCYREYALRGRQSARCQ